MKSWIVSGYAIVLGIIIGLVSWLFLSVVYKGIHVVWHTVPEQFDIPFYLFLFFPPNSWLYVFAVVAIVSKIPLPSFIHAPTKP
jgi:hypothetical protein